MVDGTAVPLAGDLTQQLAKHLDRHLVFPLLEFLHHRQLYDEADIQKAKIALLDHTNMVDFAMDIHETLYGKGSVPQAMNDRRDEVEPFTAWELTGSLHCPPWSSSMCGADDSV
jgi:eIF3 subunit 6 N terminal domain